MFTDEEFSMLNRAIMDRLEKLGKLPATPETKRDITRYEVLIDKVNSIRPPAPKLKWDGNLNDLYSVGPEKPVGYLTEADLLEHGSSIEQMETWATGKGLGFAVFPKGTGGHTSPPVYVYHRQALQKLLSDNAELLKNNRWPTNADEYIFQLASTQAGAGTDLFRFVAQTFADERNST